MSKILVVCSHPDDEILGLGATLRKHVLSGDDVYCLILGEGAVMHSIEQSELIQHALKVKEIIGYNNLYCIGLPDNKLDTLPLLEITQHIEGYLKLIEPDIVFTHHGNDLNIDHRLTFQAVITACRPGCLTVKDIYCFETPSSTEWAFDGSFKPNTFVEVDEVELSRKFAALKCYETEIRKYPHPRSIRALKSRAEFWGQVSGLEYAEAFELIRKIN
jgi:LmbE family N-acetylglucosaminyl deacetylase